MKNENDRTLRIIVGRKKKSRVSTAAQRVMKQTMPIPLDDVFESIPVETVSHLDVTLPDEKHIKIKLGESPLEIGREDSCELCLPLHNVSRVHARIILDNEEHIIEDMESTNGTFVNSVRIASCTLKNNDQIRIGEARLVYVREKIQRKA